MAETQSQPPTPSLIQKLQTSDLAQKVEKAIPGQVTQAVGEKVEKVKRVSPEIEQELRLLYEGFHPKVIHLTFLGYFLAVFLWRLSHFNIFSFSLMGWLGTGKNLFLWLFGGILGWNLPILDYLVYIYFTQPEAQLAIQAKNFLAQRKFTQAIRFLQTKDLHLSFQGVLFRLVWVGLALFALTSTASILGKGLVMGLGLNLLLAEWQEQKTNSQALNSRLFWQIKRQVSMTEQKIYLWGMTGSFAILSLLV